MQARYLATGAHQRKAAKRQREGQVHSEGAIEAESRATGAHDILSGAENVPMSGRVRASEGMAKNGKPTTDTTVEKRSPSSLTLQTAVTRPSCPAHNRGNSNSNGKGKKSSHTVQLQRDRGGIKTPRRRPLSYPAP